MKMINKRELLPLALIVLALAIGLVLYNDLPDRIPSHWNSQGEVDSFSGKTFSVLFFPGLALAVYLLMTFLPKLDPLKKNYAKFTNSYYWFRTVMVTFFVLLYFYTIGAAMGVELNINNVILPTLAIVFVFIGLFLPRIKKNYFVGIRTPWTLHSEEVWNRTHRFSGRLFFIAGLVALSGLFFSDYAFQIFIAAILSAAVISIAASYFIYRQVKETDSNLPG